MKILIIVDDLYVEQFIPFYNDTKSFYYIWKFILHLKTKSVSTDAPRGLDANKIVLFRI